MNKEIKYDSILYNVRKLFCEVFPELKDVDFDIARKQDSFENWDSFSHLELITKIEQNFNITLETEEVVDLDTPQKVVDLIKKKTTP